MSTGITVIANPVDQSVSVMVNNAEYMRVNADGTIEAFQRVTGDVLSVNTVTLRSAEYIEWGMAQVATSHPELFAQWKGQTNGPA